MGASTQILATQAISLAGYWPCNDASGTTVADNSGNGKNLTLTGTVNVDYSLDEAGQDGSAIRFLGTAGYATRTDSVLGSSPTQWTLFALVKGAVNQTSLAAVSLSNSGATAPQISILTGDGSNDDARGMCRNDANSVQYINGGGAAFDNTWHSVAFVRTATQYIMYVDGVAVNTTTAGLTTPISLNRTTIGALVRTTVGSFINSYIQHVAIWSTGLTGTEVSDIHTAAFTAVADIAITTPTEYQIVQRSGNSGQLEITGTYNEDNNPEGIEVSFNGGAWTPVDSMSGGTFSLVLTAPEGQGILEARYTNDPLITVDVHNVGIGDIFVCYGQSNVSGRGTNNQAYTHDTLIAVQYTATGWAAIADPVDANTKILDSVATDTTTPTGSIWPLIATLHSEATGVPIGLIVCAKGGQAISVFVPGADHQDRTTMYGSMVYHALQVGAIKGVLWWQGESDAAAGTSQSVYNGHLDSIADAIQTDLGVKMLVAKLQTCTDAGATAEEQAVIRAAIDEAWTDNSNILEGPDLISFESDDGFHLKTDEKLAAAAQLWWDAINTGFYSTGVFYISGSESESVSVRTGLNSTSSIKNKPIVFNGQDRFDNIRYYGKQN